LAAVWFRFRAELRTRWRAWFGLALLVGIAAGAVMGLVSGARRTNSAYSRFLEGQRAHDVMVVNYAEDDTACGPCRSADATDDRAAVRIVQGTTAAVAGAVATPYWNRFDASGELRTTR
jgi:hypothetical protein